MPDVLRIAVCDDDQIFLKIAEERLQGILSQQGTKGKITPFDSGKALISAFQKEPFDIVFLDINMPGMDGLETALELRKLDQGFMLLFLSVMNGEMHKTFTYSPRGFIRKDHMEEDFDLKVSMVLNEWKERRVAYTFNIKNEYDELESVSLRIDEIYYFSLEDRKVAVITKDKEYVTTSQSLKRTARPFEGKDFIFVDQGKFVNLRYVEAVRKNEGFDGYYVLMKNQKRLDIAGTKFKFVDKAFRHYKGRQV